MEKFIETIKQFPNDLVATAIPPAQSGRARDSRIPPAPAYPFAIPFPSLSLSLNHRGGGGKPPSCGFSGWRVREPCVKLHFPRLAPQQKYCEIRDMMQQKMEYQQSSSKCLSCGSNEHQILFCPLLQYIPLRSMLFARHNYSVP